MQISLFQFNNEFLRIHILYNKCSFALLHTMLDMILHHFLIFRNQLFQDIISNNSIREIILKGILNFLTKQSFDHQ